MTPVTRLTVPPAYGRNDACPIPGRRGFPEKNPGRDPHTRSALWALGAAVLLGTLVFLFLKTHGRRLQGTTPGAGAAARDEGPRRALGRRRRAHLQRLRQRRPPQADFARDDGAHPPRARAPSHARRCNEVARCAPAQKRAASRRCASASELDTGAMDESLRASRSSRARRGADAALAPRPLASSCAPTSRRLRPAARPGMEQRSRLRAEAVQRPSLAEPRRAEAASAPSSPRAPPRPSVPQFSFLTLGGRIDLSRARFQVDRGHARREGALARLSLRLRARAPHRHGLPRHARRRHAGASCAAPTRTSSAASRSAPTTSRSR